MPGVLATPAALCAKIKSTQASHHRYCHCTGIPCANGFNGFLRTLSGDRALLPPSSAKRLRRFSASVGAPRPHDFAVRRIATRHLTTLRPSHPAPHVPDDAQRPSWWARDGRISAFDLPDMTSELPATHWHDGQISVHA